MASISSRFIAALSLLQLPPSITALHTRTELPLLHILIVLLNVWTAGAKIEKEEMQLPSNLILFKEDLEKSI